MAETMEHQEAMELLPWLANGTLAGAERDAVSGHARSCVICRREFEVLRNFASLSGAMNARHPQQAPDMRRINGRIDALLEKQSFGRACIESLRRWATNPWRVAFVVQTAAVLVALGMLLPSTEEPAFRTLTTSERLDAGHYLRVVFDPGLAVSNIDALLGVHELTISDGPSARGVYLLRFDDSAGVDRRDAALAALQADSDILFVQAVDADPPE